MKLYYKSGACSLSPHIVLREAELPFTLEAVDLGKKITAHGDDFKKVNAKGYVPTLELDDGQILTEGPAIVQYLADRAPAKKLAPPAGTLERVRLQEWLNFISSELHKAFSPLFSPEFPEAGKTIMRDRIKQRYAFLAEKLDGKPYLMGDAFSVADAYLFTVLNWSGFVGIDLAQWPTLAAYRDRVGARPAVKAAMVAEGLIKT
jgi:glutathione S-transferase